MSILPFHPVTNLQALDIIGGKPVWPVMGGAEDAGDGGDAGGDAGNAGGDAGDAGGDGAGTDKGFPETTPLAQMTDAQKAAYYQHQNRQTDNKLRSFKGVTPEQVQQMQTRLDELESQNLNADQKAQKQAVKDAEARGRSEAEAAWRPKYQEAMLRSIASPLFSGDQDKLNAFIAMTDPSKFALDDGDIDEERVAGYLTAFVGQPDGQGNGQQFGQPQQQGGFQWGQHGGQPAAQQPGAGGLAEAERRRKAREGITS